MVSIPKKETINNFDDQRPISFSMFANKINSRIIHERLATIVTRIISHNNQSGFVKGRSIIDNALLSQEIIKDINRRNKLHNVIIKLFIAKTYDRVLWKFLVRVLR